MYESHFGLKRRPFAATPDPRCFLGSGLMQDALDELVVCVEQGQGVAVVSAPAGTGKTLLCERLRLELSKRFETVYLGHGRFLTRRAILQTILCDLNHAYRRHDEQELRLELLPAIRALSPQRDALVLICDEAHELSEDLLEELRILSDLAEAGRPLVRLVLVGQHGLEETLALPSLAALNQRIRAHVSLDTLDRASSRDYIDYRLTWAGGRTSEVFEPEAMELVCQASDGVPRCINQLCDHALLLAYVAEQKPVTAETIHEALHDLRQLPLHWNEISRVEPSTTSPVMRQPTDEEVGFVEPCVDDTAQASPGEMLSFEFGADEPTGSRPTSPDEVGSKQIPIQSAEPHDDDGDVGAGVESLQTDSSWNDDTAESHVNSRSVESVRELPGIVSVESTDSTRRETGSVNGLATSNFFVEEVVWDRYAAIDAGFEPTDAPRTELTGSHSNPSDTDSVVEVREADTAVVTPCVGSENETGSQCDESSSPDERGANTEAIANTAPNVVEAASWSNETSKPGDGDEIEHRFRSVCDRLDQLLRRSADHLEEESGYVEAGDAFSDSREWLHDNETDAVDERGSSLSSEEGLAADLSEMVHDLRGEFGGDRDGVNSIFDRLDESLKITNDIPCDDSEATAEFAEVGATTLDSSSTHEFNAASGRSREEQTVSRPYRNLFTLLRRKQQGLA